MKHFQRRIAFGFIKSEVSDGEIVPAVCFFGLQRDRALEQRDSTAASVGDQQRHTGCMDLLRTLAAREVIHDAPRYRCSTECGLARVRCGRGVGEARKTTTQRTLTERRSRASQPPFV